MISYLDNAATTFPKPRAVYSEVYRCMTKYCGNAGRGSHSLSLGAARKIFECRSAIADLFGVGELERISFTLNTTYALNTVIKGLLRRGDHVIISDIEHNAVFRPIYKAASTGEIEYDIFPSMASAPRRSPTLICAKIASLLRPNTRMVICSHASNICSMTLPIKEIGEFCHRHGLLFVVDAAQSAGHYPIDVDSMHISALCAPSHKGLYGPQGAGIIALGKGVILDTLVEGGNGVNSLDGMMPDFSPERYESGTLPTPAIAGLCEGLKYIKSRGLDDISAHEEALFLMAREKLCNLSGISMYATKYVGPTLLFNMRGFSSEELARELDSFGICARGGFHCSALAHKTLGTPEGGALRISLGAFNGEADIENLCRALNSIEK
ncbi:MAG: aminotransferase class V-fold PLP-dependent enzyme [Clostridia bacterium]|nr:aminotransferase class V-fold PLP-dependent enzyme [Clostridia bacterium]